MKPRNSELNRREFLSSLTMAAGALAVGLSPGAVAADPPPLAAPGGSRRMRISDSAYQNAFKRAEALVSQMTLDEKISQLGDCSPAVDRLKIPAYHYFTGEALYGLKPLYGHAPGTSFPMPLALAAAWNPELVLSIYSAISDEARAYDNRDKIGLSYYSPPTLNLHRDPRWGRCGEAPGEDPFLASTIAVQMVRGMQGDHPDYLKTTPCSKHFICNNTDADRSKVSATVNPRSFWEFYTRAYRSTVLDGDVFVFMGAYSALNGIPCCANHFLLTDLLRHQWGFRGYVTSDCGAVANIFDSHHYAATLPIASAMAISAGCDLNCGGTYQQYLKDAVHQNLIGEDKIGTAVTRVMTVRHLLGFFDPPEKVPYTQIPFKVVESDSHRALALEAARQSLVLLKNDAQFLPLNKANLKKVAVIGPMAGKCNLGGYSGSPTVRISPVQGIADILGVPVFRPSISVTEMVSSNPGLGLQPSSEAKMDIGSISDGNWAEFPKVDFSGKTEFQARVASASNGGRIEVHLDRLDGPLACTLTVPSTGDWQKWIDVSAPLTGIDGEHPVFLSFHGGSGFLLNLERFQLNPVSTPAGQPGRPVVAYAAGCAVTGSKYEAMFQEAVEAARDADVVIMVCGIDEDVGAEQVDRETIGLTGPQPELIQAIHAVNPKIALVLSSNNTVAVEWEQKHLPAILCALCAGQAQGTAIAEVLFGDHNPGGKLPCTWYRSVDQLPSFHDYDILKGRTYMYFEGDPLYPFGHGLSYTTFSLDKLQILSATLGPGEKTVVSARVTNTGKRPGAEVVQFYITPPPSPVKRPKKQLVGFHRVELQPGERKIVTFDLPFTEPALWYWDEGKHQFVCCPGTAKVLVGNSSASPALTGELTLKA